MELRHLSYFLVLAEELHFRRAAEKLFIAQPALTRQIKVLEQELGTVLFQRDKRNVSLTPAGKFLQKEGHQLLKKVDAIKSFIAEMGSTLAGSVSIGCIGSAMVNIVPELLQEMDQQFPQVKAQLVEDTTLNLLNQLLDGQLDILIGRPHREVPQVRSQRIFTDSTLLATATNSKWNLTQASTVADLQDVPFITYPRAAGSFFRDQLVSACSRHGFFPHIKHESLQAYSILKMVEKDLGVAVLPESIAKGYDLEVQYLELEELNFPLELVVSYRTDRDDELPKTIVNLLEKNVRR